jgi:hypothetical protein
MQRALSVLLGLAALVLAVWLVAHNYRAPTPIGADPNAHPADGGDDGSGLMFALGGDGGGASASGGGATTDDGGLPLLLSDLLRGDRMDGGPGGVMPDGTPVPALPLSTPRQVRFGVVLVSWAGAQPSPAGGRQPSRSHEDAKALADKLLPVAQQDFHAAVQQGDPGSTDDIGHIKLGILEPAPEYVLFTLPEGGVGGPVETPRGFWIVKRLE